MGAVARCQQKTVNRFLLTERRHGSYPIEVSSALPAIRPSALRRNVADVLRAALLEGRFQPGQELSDSRLASEFLVSRGPVREALFLLAEEGLVLHRQNHGFEVLRLSRADLDHIGQVRLPLEVMALKLARKRVVPAMIAHLQELKGDLLDAFRAGGTKVCAISDFAFHSAIWESSGNPWLGAALRRISMPYFAYTSAFNMGDPDHSLEGMDEIHQRYIDCLTGKSSESAEECVKSHLRLGGVQNPD